MSGDLKYFPIIIKRKDVRVVVMVILVEVHYKIPIIINNT